MSILVDIAALERPAPLPPIDHGNRRVLVVGDPPLGRGLLRTMLTRADYLVAWSPSAAEANVRLAQRSFGLALIALRLPDLPGMALARRLAEQREREGGPAVVLFGDAWDAKAVREECRQSGVSAYLEKPISFTRLMATVRGLTQSAPFAGNTDAALMIEESRIDRARFASFTQGDPQLERELGALFVSTAAGYLREMEKACAANLSWASSAHALKGASANIGASHLAELAAEAERAPPSSPTLEGLKAAFAEACKFFGSSGDAAAGGTD